jgi:RHS repeat-associated protein
LAKTAGSTTGTYAYASTSNRLSTVTTGSNVRSFSYLASGQASEDVRDGSNDYTFNYNDNGRISSASLNGGQVGTYVYNGLEQRVAKTAGGATTHYLFDRFGHMLAEYDASGTVEKEYIWLDDLPVAVVDSTGSSPVTYYIHTDHLGRPQKLTDASAAIVWDGIFQPFGEAWSAAGSATNFLMFPGQFYDYETQLSQNWHRDYDPTIGRYMQSDPIGLAGGINTYSYVGGNPILRTDPSGKIWPQVIVGMIAVGAAIYEWYEYNSHPRIPLRRRPSNPTGLCTFDNPTGEPERPELRNAGPIIPFSGTPEPPELESFPER